MSPRRAVALTLAVALGLTACGGSDKDAKKKPSVASTSTSALTPGSTLAEGAASSTTRPGSTPTTKKKAASATATTSNKSVAPAGEPDVVAVAPGIYKYTVKGSARANGTANGAPLDSTKPIDKSYDARFLPPEGRTQKATYSAGSFYLEQALRYGDATADITYLRINSGGNPVVFTPNPPARFVPMPGTVGSTWSWTMRSQPDQSGRVTTRKGDFRVERTEAVTIGGVGVPVLVITGNVTMDLPIQRTYKYTTYYSETYKLILREREVSDADVESGDKTKIHIHSDQMTTLLSLNPS